MNALLLLPYCRCLQALKLCQFFFREPRYRKILVPDLLFRCLLGDPQCRPHGLYFHLQSILLHEPQKLLPLCVIKIYCQGLLLCWHLSPNQQYHKIQWLYIFFSLDYTFFPIYLIFYQVHLLLLHLVLLYKMGNWRILHLPLL